MKCAATAGICALLLCVLVAESRARSLSDPVFLSRWRRGEFVNIAIIKYCGFVHSATRYVRIQRSNGNNMTLRHEISADSSKNYC